MAPAFLPDFDEWKKKCCHSSLSKDALVPVISSSFNVMSAVLQDTDEILIQRTLGSLDYERTQSLALEKIIEPSLRSLLYGHFKCLHMTLIHLTEGRSQSRSSEEICTRTNQFLAEVDEWKKKCCDSNLPYDFLIPVITRSFEAMTAILKDSDLYIIQRSLTSLDFDRSQSFEMEKITEPSVRSLIYGFFECLHMTFERLIEERNKSRPYGKGWTQTNEIPSQNLASRVPPYNSSSLMSTNKLSTNKDRIDNILGDGINIKEAEESNNDSMQPMEFMRDDMEFGDIPEEDDEPKGASETIPTEMVGMLSRRVSTAPRYTESSEESDDEEEETSMKNTKRELSFEGISDSETDVKKPRAKRSDTKMNCPECDFRTTVVSGWVYHLRSVHSTTPVLAGFALRCECGHESYSTTHNSTCDISNFTVIRTGNGPIRRLEERMNERMTNRQQCILCDTFSTTAYGYLKHLQTHDKSTLQANHIYLSYACGYAITSGNNQVTKHNKECNCREFTVHKIEDE